MQEEIHQESVQVLKVAFRIPEGDRYLDCSSKRICQKILKDTLLCRKSTDRSRHGAEEKACVLPGCVVFPVKLCPVFSGIRWKTYFPQIIPSFFVIGNRDEVKRNCKTSGHYLFPAVENIFMFC